MFVHLQGLKRGQIVQPKDAIMCRARHTNEADLGSAQWLLNMFHSKHGLMLLLHCAEGNSPGKFARMLLVLNAAATAFLTALQRSWVGRVRIV